jgi:hypothetical protein
MKNKLNVPKGKRIQVNLNKLGITSDKTNLKRGPIVPRPVGDTRKKNGI